MLLRLLATALAGAGAVLAVPGDLDDFVQQERERALRGALANIGPDGAESSGAKAGIVIASPSNKNPDYLSSWTRDSALTLKMLIDQYVAGNIGVERQVQDYVHAQAVLQTVRNPSGMFRNGAGLGEPRFNIDGTRFNGPWPRPQRDGPALRATALMKYAEALVTTNRQSIARDVVWPIIINDLNYIGQYWNQTAADLWEEVKSSSFFTIQNQYLALAHGSLLASKIGQTCNSCNVVAPELLCFLQNFWNGTSVIAHLNINTGRSGADVASLLGAINVFDIATQCTDASFQPCSSKILASHKVLIDSFRGIYPINAGKKPGTAVAVGRYPEDVYFDGNPWYLATTAAAEVLYDAAAQFKIQGQLTIDAISLPFFRDLYTEAKQQTYHSDSSEFQDIVQALNNYADGFVSIVQQYTPAGGALSEQFSKVNGTALSARDLTWSYAAFVTMADRRAGRFPPPLATRLERPAPTACGNRAVEGTYIPAFAAGAPNVSMECTVQTHFNVNASTFYGQNIYLLGNTSDTGLWDPNNGDGLDAANYTTKRPLWQLDIELAAGESLSYIYVRLEPSGSFSYETVNRTLQVPVCGQPGPIIEEAWIGPVSTPPL